LSPQCLNLIYPGVQAPGIDSVNIKVTVVSSSYMKLFLVFAYDSRLYRIVVSKLIKANVS